MKITSVELHPEGSSAVCVLSLRDPTRSNPYNVKGITGLDADEIIPRFYGVPGATAFYNMILAKRTVTARIELNPRYNLNETPASLRDELYKLIGASRKGLVHLEFKNVDEVVAKLSGFITKSEASLFTKIPEVQFTINCPEPMLKAPNPVSLSVVGLDPTNTTIEDELSTAPHGFTFAIGVTVGIDALVIGDPDDDWSFEVVPAGGFLTGDVIYFSSEFNNKYLYMIRAGNIVHLADVLLAGSVWPIMFPGQTNLSCLDGPSLDWLDISYYPTYWGV